MRKSISTIKDKIISLIREAIIDPHLVNDSELKRLIMTKPPLDDSVYNLIKDRLKKLSELEFDPREGRAIGVWLYKSPIEINHAPFGKRDKGRFLLVIIRNNELRTLYWKHKKEGGFDISVNYETLMNNVKENGRGLSPNKPITFNWVKSLSLNKNPLKKRNKYKKIKLSDGNIVKYFEDDNEFRDINDNKIDIDDIFEKLPIDVQELVLDKLTENVKNNISILCEKHYIFENFNNKTLFVVDIQPEYYDYFSHWLNDFVEFLNKSGDQFNNIVFLYNGDSLGMINKNEYKIWLDKIGIDNYIIENSIFYDKGYGFFRSCIDSNVSEDDITKLVKFMLSKGYDDSRELTTEDWDEFLNDTGLIDVVELLRDTGEVLFLTDLINFIKHFNNIILVGGGINECLLEVEIALKALDKKYNLLDDYLY